MDHQSYLLAHYRGLAKKLISGNITAEQFAEEQAKIHLDLEKRVYLDGLVENFLNNTGFTNFLGRELKLIKKIPHLNGTLLTLDIDYLKKFNDTMGHIKGDKLIKTYAEVIAQYTRESDIKGRLGGDEFAVFLIGSNLENAQVIAERIRVDIIEKVKNNFPELAWEQTISIGITLAGTNDTAESLRLRADNALYEAKKKRNTVSVAST